MNMRQSPFLRLIIFTVNCFGIILFINSEFQFYRLFTGSRNVQAEMAAFGLK